MAVLFNLLRPERSPNASRWTVVVGAAMPEAAVDQNHDSLLLSARQDDDGVDTFADDGA